VRSSTTSWKLKRSSPRLPRVGVTKPASTSAAMTPRDNPSIDWMPRSV
jgi:hypothetical protein